MSNQTLSLAAYSAEIMGDLSTNPKFNGMAHIQSNLGVWDVKDSGVKYPLIALEGGVEVEGGYLVILAVNLGVLFGVYHQNENGTQSARHARGAIYISSASISPETKSSLDSFMKEVAEWTVTTPVKVTTPAYAEMLEAAGVELRRGVIRDKDKNDTGCRFRAISFGRTKAMAIIECEEVELDNAIEGYTTSWRITSFKGAGNYRFRKIGEGAEGSTLAAVQAEVLDLDAYQARDIDVIEKAQTQAAQAAAPVTQVAEVPAAPKATSRSFVRT